MKKAPTIEAAVSATNSAQETSTNMSSNACETLPPSNDERAAVNERFATLLKRFMKRKSEFGDGEALDAVTRPSLSNRPGLMDAEAAAKTEWLRETIALHGMITPACAGPVGAAGDLSENRPSRRPTGDTPDRAELSNSERGENRIITPRPLADRA